MPLSRRVAHFNRYVTNPLGRLVAGRRFIPLLILMHTGRVSGKRYRTPLLGFRGDGELVVVLTYGPEVDWLKNLLAAGGGEIMLQGKRWHVGAPAVAELNHAAAVPGLIRWGLSHTGIHQIARLPLLPVDRPA